MLDPPMPFAEITRLYCSPRPHPRLCGSSILGLLTPLDFLGPKFLGPFQLESRLRHIVREGNGTISVKTSRPGGPRAGNDPDGWKPRPTNTTN
jgi:hypothetical protein